MKQPDVVIVGAGAAGLAAASAFADAGIEALVLEARDRIGGRVFTEQVSGLAMPLELGAEFIHGRARVTEAVARAHGLPMVDIADHRYLATGRTLTRSVDYWAKLDRVLRKLDGDRAVDRSFRDALEANRKSIRPIERALAVQYVEGFDAADPRLMSEKALASAGSPSDDPRELRIGRPVGGYRTLIDALARNIRSSVRLGVVVSRIQWRRGKVVVESRDRAGNEVDPIPGRAAIITVPIGVLSSPPGSLGAIALEPAVPAIDRAVEQIAMGSVVKLVFLLNSELWRDERFGERLQNANVDSASFFHATKSLPFPVWWTAYPFRVPSIVAWCGGPRATELSRRHPTDLEALAIQSLGWMFSMRETALRKHVIAVFHHDWQGDPFSRGAYSYARVGGHGAAVRLAEPVARTLWFAGEAAARDGRTGTVDGAIASGLRAAKQVVRAF